MSNLTGFMVSRYIYVSFHRPFIWSFYGQVLRKYLTGGFCGHARDGSPVRVEPFGRLDMKGLMCSVKKSDLEKAKIQQCEWTVKDWEEQSKKVHRTVYNVILSVQS